MSAVEWLNTIPQCCEERKNISLAPVQQAIHAWRPEAWLQNFRLLTRGLRHRNFQIYLGGQFLSLIGTWVQMAAQSWLVYRLTHSSVMLGLVAFAGQISFLLLSPVAGVVADRINRRRLFIVTQTLAMLLAALLAVLTLTGIVKPWHIFYVALATGLVTVFDNTARQALQVEMVGKEDLLNALALSSSVYNTGRILGPAIAGLLVASIGEGWCFVVNAVSFLPLIAGLLVMRLRTVPRANSAPTFRQFREGLDYIWNYAPARSLLLLLAVCSIMNYPYVTLMPIFADEVLHGGPKTLGILMSASGIGAIVGAIYMATRPEVVRLSRTISSAAMMSGVALVVFSFSRNLQLSMLGLAATAAGIMMQATGTNTTLQTIVPDSFRGRVVGFYAMTFWGMAPIGSLLAGWSSRLIGPRYTVAVGGAACIAAALAYNRRQPIVREALAQSVPRNAETTSAVKSVR